MPVAYCVIELVFDAEGHGVDFVFRYCNKQMEVVEGIGNQSIPSNHWLHFISLFMCGIDSAFIMCTFCIIKFLFKCDILFQQFLSFKCPQFEAYT